MRTEYSDKEIELIKALGYEDLIDTSISPPSLYRVMAEKCFLDDIRDSRADSVRRCMKALCHTVVYRMTPQWDELIQLD